MALITAQEVITLAFKEDQVMDSNHFVNSYIETIELIYIRPFFQQVFDNIIAKDGAGLTTNETELVSRIKKPLALWCKHDIIPELSLSLNNAGVQAYGNEFSNPVSSAHRAELQGVISRHAEVLMDNVMIWFKLQDDLTQEATQEKDDFNGDIVL